MCGGTRVPHTHFNEGKNIQKYVRREREAGILFTSSGKEEMNRPKYVSGCLLSTAVTRIRIVYKSMTQNSGQMTTRQEKV